MKLIDLYQLGPEIKQKDNVRMRIYIILEQCKLRAVEGNIPHD